LDNKQKPIQQTSQTAQTGHIRQQKPHNRAHQEERSSLPTAVKTHLNKRAGSLTNKINLSLNPRKLEQQAPIAKAQRSQNSEQQNKQPRSKSAANTA
jgi:hypothetical protein